MSRINAIILWSFVALAVGFGAAWLIWGRKPKTPPPIEEPKK